MSDIKLDIPDIGIVVSRPSAANTLVELPDITVVMIAGHQYLSTITAPSNVRIDEDNYFRVADLAFSATSASFALTASYALNADGQSVPRFILPDTIYTIRESQQTYAPDIFNYGTLKLEAGTVSLLFGDTIIKNDSTLTLTDTIYNMGIIENEGTIQLVK
jgi:hypothetical protein